MSIKPDIKEIIAISKEAGAAIMEVYGREYKTELKDDENNSPLTEADLAANEIIVEKLKGYGIPIMTEENIQLPYEERKDWEEFWLVDPLDGTKEFIQKNGNFTVNIALIRNKKPILGVIYVPAKEKLYYGDEDGAFMEENGEKKELNGESDHEGMIAVASKNHMNQETKDYIEKLGDVELVSIGSSLKFCLVAEGKADIYPRLGPTMEWDTGAANAIVNAAGKKVLKLDSDEELEYNKEDLHNPYFVVK